MPGLPQVFTDHRRSFEDHHYVYAVVSRRSRGVSLGINLNPDKICNFDCVYCQVDRTTPGAGKEVDLGRLEVELASLIAACTSGTLFDLERFRQTPEALRRLNDIAFSGDGEPTSCPVFLEAVQLADRLREAAGLTQTVKLVLITNATLLDRPRVRQALEIFHNRPGEIWAKLDAGTETYYHRVERTAIPFARVLANLRSTACRQPLVIQSMFLKLDGLGPEPGEIEAYCDRLEEILHTGGKLDRIQIYTVARKPAEANVSALSDAEVDALAARVRQRLAVPVETFYGG